MPLQERYNPVWPLAGRMLDATREFVSLLTVTPTMNDPGSSQNRQFPTGHFARQSDEISAHLNCGQQATYNSRLARVHMD
jgi:hypothetical protein